MIGTRWHAQVKAAPPASFAPVARGALQRKCACGGAPGRAGACEECSNEKLNVQRRAAQQAEPSSVPPIVPDVLRSEGQPLDGATRALMEPRFGHDFSRVRVHTDAKAAESARAVNALAYTVGRNVVFDKEQYNPSAAVGRRVLAHELTHVIQQEGQTGSVLARLAVDAATNEAEAERTAGLVSTGDAPTAPTQTTTNEGKCVNGHWETGYSGCSVPWYAAALLGFGDADDPAIGFHSPGNPTGARKDTRFAIPETRTGACDRHDACYQMCWPKENKEQYKQACDEQFLEDMLDTCASTEGGELRRCMRAAKVYYRVLQLVGHIAFNKDQAESCACEGG
jgi:hypothetical protein